MDESFYTNLIEEANSSNDTNNNNNNNTPISLSVILSRTTKNTKSIRISVAAKIPRKRNDCDDTIQYSLRYFSFLDDVRMFSNLDSLLTQFSPVGVVHLGCTESAEVKSKGNNDNNSNKNKQARKANEVSKLLTKVSNIINSRSDITTASMDDATNDTIMLSNIITTLPKEVQSISSSTSSTSSTDHPFDSIISHLLGRDEKNNQLNQENYNTYKNDTNLLDDKLAQKAIMLLLQMEDIISISNDNTKGIYELQPGDITSYLTMDRTAMECINLLPPSHAGISNVVVGGSSDTSSLFGVLNRCKTKMGSRMLEMWLRQPSVDLETILYRQSAVGVMADENGLGRDRLRDEGLGGLRGVDLDGLCQKLSNYDATGGGSTGGTSKVLECMYRLHLFSDKQLPILLDTLIDLVPPTNNSNNNNNNNNNESNEEMNNDSNNNDSSSSGALEKTQAGLNQVMEELCKSVQLVEAVLDFDAAPREFLVKSTFSDDLQELRGELDSIEEELQHIHNYMNEAWSEESGESVGQVRLERDGSGGNSGGGKGGGGSSCVWQFRLADANKSKILEKMDHVVIHRILKNGVYFSTKELTELGSKKHDIMVEYEKHQRQIVQDAMDIAVTYIPVLERASQLIAELDVLASLAHLAAFNPFGYCKPQMTDSDDDGFGIELKEARHPCVELQDNVNFIPNNFDLVYGSSSFLLVTGPNCGGKSTYIRSLGAIITMAQIGSYVPCTSAKINIVHHILARVGAGDAQDRGISTFMAEMLEASSILRTATKRSLIIIDELGRGTSTVDGYGLASAISEYIVQNIGCMTVFATHFHELTSLEESEKVVKNCHVTACRATDGSNGLSFLYEVRPGPCLESFGIQVAEMANVPKSVVLDAKRKAAELENFDCSKRRKSQVVYKKGNDEDETSPSSASQGSNNDMKSALKLLNILKNLPLDTMTSGEQRNAVMSLLQ